MQPYVPVIVSDRAELQENCVGKEPADVAETQPGGFSRKTQLHSGTKPPS